MDQAILPAIDLAQIDELYRTHVNPGRARVLREFFGAAPVLAEREGPRFRDARDGRWYWNCHCNGGVFNLGHRNPRVVRALREALDTLDVGNMWLASGYRAELARRLSATTDGLLPGVVFAGVGGEAVDAAIKLARGHTGRRAIVSAEGAYHGHTGLALSTGHPKFREPFLHDLPDFATVQFNDLEALDRAVDERTAAVVLEAIPATSGVDVPEPGYLRGAERLCRDRGALLIVDEVQTGLGRTGTFWYYQQEAIEPDMVITGKGLSGGIYPMAAALVREEFMAPFDKDPFVHLSTFAGSELGCVVSLAVLDVVEEPGFLEHVRALSELFATSFADLPFELRRRGLFMGFKWPNEGDGIEASRKLIDNGVFCVFSGNDTSVTQFHPTLILTDDQASEVAGLVRQAFA
jgi:acetylornithine/succinyldiaminopimelate/putrescine aminotransferase